MIARNVQVLALTIFGAGGLFLFHAAAEERAATPPKDKNVVVTLCDGVTKMELQGVKPGDEVDRARAQGFANQFMDIWRKNHPGQPWLMAQAAPPKPAPPARNPVKNPAASTKPAEPPKQSEIYNRFGPRDEFVWKTELEKFVKEGDRVFHDAKAFGGTVGVSCDMCHPNASNTHPETYPKYQVQLQRVALLRDMINWCIQNPTKGKPLADDDPRLRAMEAYIVWQRRGKDIEPGKH
jgi:thiosulfate dehydrogenase